MWNDMSYNKYKNRQSELEFEQEDNYDYDHIDCVDSDFTIESYGLYEDIETLEKFYDE